MTYLSIVDSTLTGVTTDRLHHVVQYAPGRLPALETSTRAVSYLVFLLLTVFNSSEAPAHLLLPTGDVRNQFHLKLVLVAMVDHELPILV